MVRDAVAGTTHQSEGEVPVRFSLASQLSIQRDAIVPAHGQSAVTGLGCALAAGACQRGGGLLALLDVHDATGLDQRLHCGNRLLENRLQCEAAALGSFANFI
jgi:hypothetical protein